MECARSEQNRNKQRKASHAEKPDGKCIDR